jgi:hypothetical protein
MATMRLHKNNFFVLRNTQTARREKSEKINFDYNAEFFQLIHSLCHWLTITDVCMRELSLFLEAVNCGDVEWKPVM